MQIEHAAIYTHNLEGLKTFYETYFNASSGSRYHNPRTGHESYFLSFDTGARLELMRRPDIPVTLNDPARQFTGFIHLAFSAGSPQAVDDLTTRLSQDGFVVVDGPRWTGDGYYESAVLDPDGNRVEIIA